MTDKGDILRHLQQLGKAVTGCLNESDEVKSIIKYLEEKGLNLNLSFVAMISGSKPLAFPVSWTGGSRELKFEITEEDREFLASLGIKYDDKKTDVEAGEAESDETGGAESDETGVIDQDGETGQEDEEEG